MPGLLSLIDHAMHRFRQTEQPGRSVDVPEGLGLAPPPRSNRSVNEG